MRAIAHIDGGERIADEPRRAVRVLAERAEVTITWSRYGAGERGPDLHVHREHTDAFYVLDGEVTFAVGPRAEKVRVGHGGFVAVPPGVVHCFANETDADACWLNLHAPDTGFAAYLRDLRDGRPIAFDSFDPPTDGGRPATEVVVSAPGEGERLVAGNRVVSLKAVLPELSVAEWTLDGPFDGPHANRHDGRVDAFYVLEGELELTVEDAVHAAGPGTLAAIPPGVRHTFAHRGSGLTRVLDVHAPDGGFAEFLRRTSG